MAALDELKAMISTYETFLPGLGEEASRELSFGKDFENLTKNLESYPPDELKNCLEQLNLAIRINIGDNEELLKFEIAQAIGSIIEEKERVLSSSVSSVSISPVRSDDEALSRSPVLVPEERAVEIFAEKLRILEEIRTSPTIDEDIESTKSGEEYQSNTIVGLLTDHYIHRANVLVNNPMMYLSGEQEILNRNLQEVLGKIGEGEILVQPILQITDTGRQHWVSAVIQKNEGKTDIVIADSMFNSISPIDRTRSPYPMVDSFQRAIPEAHIHNFSVYQQNNDIDCGAWLVDNSMKITDHILTHHGIAPGTTRERIGLTNDPAIDPSNNIREGARHGARLRSEHRANMEQIKAGTGSAVEHREPLRPSPVPRQASRATSPRSLGG